MSKNKQSIEFYKSLAINVTDAKILKFSNDNTHYDVDFIRSFSKGFIEIALIAALTLKLSTA